MRDKPIFPVCEGRDGLLTATGYLLLFAFLLRGSSLLSPYLAEMGLAWARYVLSPLAYIIPLLLALLCERNKKPILFAWPRERAFCDVLPLLPLFLGLVMALAYLSELLFDLLGLVQVGGGVAGFGFLPDLLLNCLLPAALEELFFRGLILSLLLRQMGEGAIWLSAVVFAIAHGSLYQMPYAFVGGVLLALAAVMSGSVLIPFVFHFLNNFLSTVQQYTPRTWDFRGPALLLIYAAVMIAMMLSVWYLLRKKDAAAGNALASLFASPREEARGVWRAAALSPLAFYLIPMLILTLWRTF